MLKSIQKKLLFRGIDDNDRQVCLPVYGLLFYLRATMQIYSMHAPSCSRMRDRTSSHSHLQVFVIVYTTPQQDSRIPLPAFACDLSLSILLFWTPSSLNKV